jgi:hypothetical protein
MTRLMKTTLSLGIIILFIFSANFAFAASSPGEGKSTQGIALHDSGMTIALFLQLKPKESERLTGHKLTLKEKIAVKIYKLKLRKKINGDDPAKNKRLGTLSLIFGIGAFVIVFIPVLGILSLPLAIAAVVLGAISLKGNKNTNGIIGLILGGTFILLFIVAVLLVIAFLGTY